MGILSYQQCVGVCVNHNFGVVNFKWGLRVLILAYLERYCIGCLGGGGGEFFAFSIIFGTF